MATKADLSTRRNYLKAIQDLQRRSMDPQTPVPQRMALLNRSQEMRAQMMEIEAARFNANSNNYVAAIKTLNTAILDLRKSIANIENAIKILNRASAAFAAADKLLTTAVEHFPIPS